MTDSDKLKKILKELNLRVEKQPNSSGNFYTAICSNKNKEYYVLKVKKSKKREIKNKFLNEIKMHSFFLDKNTSIILPEIISSNTKTSPEWLLYKYISGETLGVWYKFKNNEENLIKKILPIQDEILKINIPQKNLYKFSNKIKDTEKYIYNLLKKPETEKIFDKKKIKNLYTSAKKKLELFPQKNILIHGDLSPSNIVRTKGNKIALIDWYETGYGNFGYDLAFLWFILWNKPEEQKLFSEKINKKEISEKVDLFNVHIDLLRPKILLIFTDLILNLEKLKKEGKYRKKEEDEMDELKKGIYSIIKK